MGLVDKLKEQAAVAGAAAKDAVEKGQERVDDAQAKRHADAVLRELGLQVLLERTGRGSVETAGVIDAKLADLAAYEAEHGPLG
jgi:hypothetical protein